MNNDELSRYYGWLILLAGKGVIIISLLPLIFGLLQWRKLNRTLKIFWFFLLASLVLYLTEQLFVWCVGRDPDYWMQILKAHDISDTNFLRYPYHLINFTLLGWFLYRALLPWRIAQGIKYLSAVLVIAVTVNYFSIQGYNMAGGFNSTVSALYCCLLPLLLMWFLYNRDSIVPLVHNPYFWINLGLIVPSLIGLFLYFSGDVMFHENFTLYAQLTILKSIVEMIAQILTAIGFYYARNTKYLDPISTRKYDTLQQIDRTNR